MLCNKWGNKDCISAASHLIECLQGSYVASFFSYCYCYKCKIRINIPCTTHTTCVCAEQHNGKDDKLDSYWHVAIIFSLFFERSARIGAMCVSSMETEKTLLSQRSLSPSIIQSQQNREAWRAQRHHSELEFLHFVPFPKKKAWKSAQQACFQLCLQTEIKKYCWCNVPQVTIKSQRSHHTGQNGQLYGLLTLLNFFF